MADDGQRLGGAAQDDSAPEVRSAKAGAEPTLPASDVRVAPNMGLIGREIAGRYRVLDQLGEGGMGVVYIAEHLHLRRKVALKVIHPELGADEELLLRFKREALATGQLDHPHIAAALDFDVLEDHSAFIVMPWVRGHSLQAELDTRGATDYRRAARLGAQICDALSAAHSLGIVHRDLKPDNVLIETRGDGTESVRVLDFGVASLSGRAERISAETARPLTQAGTILGTPGYMSPEQATAGEVDHRTDLYAVGVILWELCRGERLFAADDVTSIFAKQFKQLPPALTLGDGSGAAAFSDLVARLLAWNKHDRPETALAVRDELRRIAEGLSEPSRDGSLPFAPTPTLGTGKALERRVVIAYAVAAVAVLVAVLSAFGGGEGEEVAADESGAVTEVAAPPEVAKPEPKAQIKPLSDELKAAIQTLSSDETRGRRDAAIEARTHPQEVPPFVLLLAELELASGCRDKRDVVDKMITLGDPRVVPALERLSRQRRTGCGFLRLGDCLLCLRHRLDEALGALRIPG